MKAFLRLMGKLCLAVRFKELITNCIPSSEAPSSTSLLVGFGDSCHLGANSVVTRWALHGREPQRAASKSRTSWGRAGRPIREYIGFRAIARRFLHKVEMTRRKTSTKVRQLSDTRRYPIGTCCQTALLVLRQLFDKCSTALPLFFDNDSKGCRRTVEEQWENPRRNVGAGIAQVISRYGRPRSVSRSSVGESGLMSRLIPRAFLVLFCVCLARARQRGVGSPVATGVAYTLCYNYS